MVEGINKIFEFLSSYGWQTAGIVLAIIALMVRFVIYHLQTKVWLFTYQKLEVTPLVPSAEDISDDFEIYYKKKKIKHSDIKLLFLEFANNGNQPISKEDFEQEVEIAFAETVQILSVEVEETNPRELEISVLKSLGKKKSSKVANNVYIEPALLNPNDSFILKFYLKNYSEELFVKSRIKNVEKIREDINMTVYTWEKLIKVLALALLMCVFVFIPIGFLIGYLTIYFNIGGLQIFLACVVFFLITMTIGTWLDRKRRFK